MTGTADMLGRPLRDLRISVTDRCNLRCPYCMPAEVFGPDHAFLQRSGILTFEEIIRVVRLMTELGVRKVRLTGGEPLLRRELPELVRMIRDCRQIEDLALTTNGLLLDKFARGLRDAGLGRVTVSLDAIDDGVFRVMSGSARSVAEVLGGIDAALAAGLAIKINCVVRRGINEDQVLPLAEYARRLGIMVRFIEFMDVGNHNRWHSSSVMPAREVLGILDRAFGVAPLEPSLEGEVAKRYRYLDGGGEVGLVTSITQPFCRDCNRARLTADGKLVTCLFASGGADVRTELRKGVDDVELAAFLLRVWEGRSDRYSELRAASQPSPAPRIEMSYVGG